MIREEIIRHFGVEILSQPFGSALAQKLHGQWGEDQFQMILEFLAFWNSDKKFKLCVEIGTCNGISACMLTQFAEEVITFDISDNFKRIEIWKHFGISKKIKSYVLKNKEEIRSTTVGLNFDLAYIDGSHEYGDIVYDIETIENCGCENIVFHDYDLYSKDHVMKAVHELLLRNGGKFLAIPPFAVWRKTE